MKFDKSLETKFLKLRIVISTENDISHSICSGKRMYEIQNDINNSINHLHDLLYFFENQYKEELEMVGK